MKRFRLLKASEIDCRIATVKSSGISLLLYKDARCDMNILDDTFGIEGWQRQHELIDGQLFCNIGIWVDRRGDGYGEWVWKQDVGVESYTEKEKGRASDAFKRACFNLGIGRELYSAPFIWINSKDKGGCADILQNGQKYTCYDRFYVQHIDYDENENISELIINKDCGYGNDIEAYWFGISKRAQTPQEDQSEKLIDQVKVAALQQFLEEKGIGIEYVLEKCRINDLSQLTEYNHSLIINSIDKVKKGYEKWRQKAG